MVTGFFNFEAYGFLRCFSLERSYSAFMVNHEYKARSIGSKQSLSAESTDKGEFFRMPNGFKVQINIQIGPVQMSRRW